MVKGPAYDWGLLAIPSGLRWSEHTRLGQDSENSGDKGVARTLIETVNGRDPNQRTYLSHPPHPNKLDSTSLSVEPVDALVYGRQPKTITDLRFVDLFVIPVLRKRDAEHQRAMIRNRMRLIVFANRPYHLEQFFPGQRVTVDTPVSFIRVPNETSCIPTSMPTQLGGERFQCIKMAFQEFTFSHRGLPFSEKNQWNRIGKD